MWPAREMSLSSGSKGWQRPPGRDRSRKRTLRKLPLDRKPEAAPARHPRISLTSMTGPAYRVVPFSSRSWNLYSAYKQDYSARSRRGRTLDRLTHGPSYVVYAIRDGTTLLQHQEFDCREPCFRFKTLSGVFVSSHALKISEIKFNQF